VTRLIALAVGTATIVGVPALACTGPQYEQYVFLDAPPKIIPPGTILLKVQAEPVVADYPPNGKIGVLRAKVVTVEIGRFKKKIVSIQPFSWMSCDRLGVIDQPSFVVGPVYRTKAGVKILIPMKYRKQANRTEDEDRSIGTVVPKLSFLPPNAP
jgi:hypothetical protein